MKKTRLKKTLPKDRKGKKMVSRKRFLFSNGAPWDLMGCMSEAYSSS